VVASGWFDSGVGDPGAWNRYCQRPSAGIDSLTDDIYCLYQRYIDPTGYSPIYPYPCMTFDTLNPDISAGGWPNGEIWITKSVDDGLSWSEGINVTDTNSPDAPPGQCLSELTPSMAPNVVNGYCHIFYVLDKDAGAVMYGEGTWTLNDVKYQRVPIDSIPETPLLPPYPMHCDSTGLPPVQAVNSLPTAPASFYLYPPYPNPFNSSIALRFELSDASPVELKIFDLSGREVASIVDPLTSGWSIGEHSIMWEAKGISSGIYFVQLSGVGSRSVVQKILLVK
jgi:hypothetical protein